MKNPWPLVSGLYHASLRPELIREVLDIRTKTLRSSELRGFPELRKTERVLALCKELGATEYLSGGAARDYLQVDQFAAANIKVIFQDYQHPSYAQRYKGFISHLSVLDVLMNEGPHAKEIILSGSSQSPERMLERAA